MTPAPHPRRIKSVRAFLDNPSAPRNAIRLIIAATTLTTLAGAVVVWILDRQDFAHFGDALWWSLQTVTTVGYGDVTPKHAVGRIVGAFVLLFAVAFLAVLTASITSIFIEQARETRRDKNDERATTAQVVALLDEVSARLDAIDRRLDEQRGQDG